MSGSFEEIDHSADTGLKITGDTQEELFEAAARGMFSIITDLSKVGSSVSDEIEIIEDDPEELLMCWFRELLYRFSVDYVLYRDFECVITQNAKGSFILNARCAGDRYIQGVHDIHTEIKTATYHQFSLTEEAGRWHAQVIFDL